MPQPNLAIALVGGGGLPNGTPAVTRFPIAQEGETTDLTFSVQNLGSEPLQITNITVPSGMTVAPSILAQLTGGLTLAANQGLDVPVSFRQNRAGDVSGNFVVQSNDPDTPAYSFPVAGTAIPGAPDQEGSTSLDLNGLIALVTAVGAPVPGTVDNTIADGDGSVVLEGSPVRDLFGAGAGNDLLLGRDGNDYLFGEGGNDTLLGENGDDSLSGATGDDFLFAGPGNDLLVGQSGADVINGNQGADTLGGGEGNDLMFGGRDDDLLAGGIGADVLFGDRGNDTLFGGVDGDQFALIPNAGSDVILDYNDGLDKFLLVGELTFEAIQVVDVPAGVALRRGNEVLATVLGQTAEQIDPSDFQVLPPAPPTQ